MIVDYDWKITKLAVVNKNEFRDVVIQIFWRYVGYDETYVERSSVYGKTILDTSKLNEFIEYENIKEEDLKKWLSAAHDVASLQKNVDHKLYLQGVEESSHVTTFPWEPIRFAENP